MGRPKKISDAELLAACAEVIGRHGPGFTLAQVATESGVAVGTVAGRFGSKLGLLVAFMDGGTTLLEERMVEVAREQDDPVEALRAALLLPASGVGDPKTTAHHLAQLGTDLAEPRLRERFAVQRAAVRAVVSRLVAAADLPGAPPPPQAAIVLASLVNGLLLEWALAPNGDLRTWVGTGVDSVLSAWQGPRAHA